MKMVITIYSNLHDLIKCAFGMLPSRGGMRFSPLEPGWAMIVSTSKAQGNILYL